jgi:hypothetical protein
VGPFRSFEWDARYHAGFLDDEFDYGPAPAVKEEEEEDDELPRVKEDVEKDEMADYLVLLAWQEQ